MIYPASAGVYLSLTVSHFLMLNLPRARGDVPGVLHYWNARTGFTPRSRRCSLFADDNGLCAEIYPAPAGVYLRPVLLDFGCSLFTPRLRGCSRCTTHSYDFETIYPAPAGMYLPYRFHPTKRGHLPRVCGGVPTNHLIYFAHRKFTPRLRGCSPV